MSVRDWVDRVVQDGGLVLVKRLSANDSGATGGHQAGPYIPKRIAFRIAPVLADGDAENPRVQVDVESASHDHVSVCNLIWYNNAGRGGTRDEIRLTGFGGATSPILNPEMTGALLAMSFRWVELRLECSYWLCETTGDEDSLERYVGPVEPGMPRLWVPDVGEFLTLDVPSLRRTCWLTPSEVPQKWHRRFPSTTDLVNSAIEHRPERGRAPDDRLIRRRDCEFELFRSVESVWYERETRGRQLDSEEFLAVANSMTNRRRARSGRSLELHLAAIFEEEGLEFDAQVTTEGGKKPDFLFPSQVAYLDRNFPPADLLMLGVKTILRERWRQVQTEADRIACKHLFTLQEGVSPLQFEQMTDAGLRLVVPRQLHRRYPARLRSELLSLSEFVQEVRRRQ